MKIKLTDLIIKLLAIKDYFWRETYCKALTLFSCFYFLMVIFISLAELTKLLKEDTLFWVQAQFVNLRGCFGDHFLIILHFCVLVLPYFFYWQQALAVKSYVSSPYHCLKKWLHAQTHILIYRLGSWTAHWKAISFWTEPLQHYAELWNVAQGSIYV